MPFPCPDCDAEFTTQQFRDEHYPLNCVNANEYTWGIPCIYSGCKHKAFNIRELNSHRAACKNKTPEERRDVNSLRCRNGSGEPEAKRWTRAAAPEAATGQVEVNSTWATATKPQQTSAYVPVQVSELTEATSEFTPNLPSSGFGKTATASDYDYSFNPLITDLTSTNTEYAQLSPVTAPAESLNHSAFDSGSDPTQSDNQLPVLCELGCGQWSTSWDAYTRHWIQCDQVGNSIGKYVQAVTAYGSSPKTTTATDDTRSAATSQSQVGVTRTSAHAAQEASSFSNQAAFDYGLTGTQFSMQSSTADREGSRSDQMASSAGERKRKADEISSPSSATTDCPPFAPPVEPSNSSSQQRASDNKGKGKAIETSTSSLSQFVSDTSSQQQKEGDKDLESPYVPAVNNWWTKNPKTGVERWPCALGCGRIFRSYKTLSAHWEDYDHSEMCPEVYSRAINQRSTGTETETETETIAIEDDD